MRSHYRPFDQASVASAHAFPLVAMVHGSSPDLTTLTPGSPRLRECLWCPPPKPQGSSSRSEWAPTWSMVIAVTRPAASTRSQPRQSRTFGTGLQRHSLRPSSLSHHNTRAEGLVVHSAPSHISKTVLSTVKIGPPIPVFVCCIHSSLPAPVVSFRVSKVRQCSCIRPAPLIHQYRTQSFALPSGEVAKAASSGFGAVGCARWIASPMRANSQPTPTAPGQFHHPRYVPPPN